MLSPFLADDEGGLLDTGSMAADAEMDTLPEAMPSQQLPSQQQQQPPPMASFFGEITRRATLDRAAQHAKMLALLARLTEQEALESKHAVEFFEKVQRAPTNRQQLKGCCMACGKLVSSTGSSRLIKHMLVCPLLPMEVVKQFKQLKNMSSEKVCGKREAEALASEEAEVWARKHSVAQAALKQSSIKASMQSGEAAWADKCIAEFFYANAIPFSAASPDTTGLYKRMVDAIKASPAGYRPPNYNKLANDLLDSCYDNMWRSIVDRDPNGSLALKYGATYVTDGWDSCDHLSLINSAFISNNDGGIFWRSVDTSGKVKCAEYTASLMIADIYNFGPTKVVLVITDTCAVMQKAWDIVMYEFPWIMCLPCQPHVISLLLKDIGKTAEVGSAMHWPSQCARRSIVAS